MFTLVPREANDLKKKKKVRGIGGGGESQTNVGSVIMHFLIILPGNDW